MGCHSCHKPLSYLGYEQASISPQHILSYYDQKHPLSTAFFEGTYKTYAPSPSSLDILQCEDQLKKKPDDLDALYFLARFHASQKQISKAIFYNQRLIEVNPHFFEAHKALAKLYFYEKKLTDCHAILTHLIAVDPDHYEHYDNLGLVYLHQKNLKQALYYFQMAYDLSTDRSSAQTRLSDMVSAINLQLQEPS